MPTEPGSENVKKHGHLRGHTLRELYQRDDGTWVATQLDVDVEGTGETGALAATNYCRKIAAGRATSE